MCLRCSIWHMDKQNKKWTTHCHLMNNVPSRHSQSYYFIHLNKSNVCLCVCFLSENVSKRIFLLWFIQSKETKTNLKNNITMESDWKLVNSFVLLFYSNSLFSYWNLGFVTNWFCLAPDDVRTIVIVIRLKSGSNNGKLCKLCATYNKKQLSSGQALHKVANYFSNKLRISAISFVLIEF